MFVLDASVFWAILTSYVETFQTQLRIDAFYSFNQRFAKVRSARIQKALQGTKGRQLSNELLDVTSEGGSPPAKKPKKKSSKEATSAGTKSSELLVEDGGDPKGEKGSGRGTIRVRGTSRGKGGRQAGQRGSVGTVSVDSQSVEDGKLDESQGDFHNHVTFILELVYKESGHFCS